MCKKQHKQHCQSQNELCKQAAAAPASDCHMFTVLHQKYRQCTSRLTCAGVHVCSPLSLWQACQQLVCLFQLRQCIHCIQHCFCLQISSPPSRSCRCASAMREGVFLGVSCLVKSRVFAHLVALGLVSMMLRCMIVKTVELVDRIMMRKTDCFGKARLVPHLPS